VKAKLLVVELWGLGDLIIATPFLQAASQRYDVTLAAKPYAMDLQRRFWPDVRVVPFVAPWTAFRFKDKYRLYAWPWREMFRLLKPLAAQRFDFGLSARWGDPRDHLLLLLAGAKARLGFPRLGTGVILTKPLARPEPLAHRCEYWRVMARVLGFDMPARESLTLPHLHPDGEILVHTGAGQPVRIWPLERYRTLVVRLRQKGYRVQVACDPDERTWWLHAGEKDVATPRTVTVSPWLGSRANRSLMSVLVSGVAVPAQDRDFGQENWSLKRRPGDPPRRDSVGKKSLLPGGDPLEGLAISMNIARL